MPGTNPVYIFVRKFDELGAPYMVSGSVASMVYGESRLTNDIDLVADLHREHIDRLPEIFPHPEFYCPPTEITMVEARRRQRGHINIIHNETMFKADVYLRGEEPLNSWGFARCERLEFEGETMVVAPPEYIIIRKLEFFREGGSEKHLRDIRAMLLAARVLKYRDELEQFIDQRGLQVEWKKAQQHPEP